MKFKVEFSSCDETPLSIDGTRGNYILKVQRYYYKAHVLNISYAAYMLMIKSMHGDMCMSCMF